ncbi:transcription termination/antitermination protein NusG [Limisphaera sp. VF-2]|jgi:transcriptional antiterminator RfaH|uniref:transcription termination/antitermination protein NusG n=1 Tax=Limisphaera sp. VF-2 TaxID=3400418 RepID=UPI00175ED2CA
MGVLTIAPEGPALQEGETRAPEALRAWFCLRSQPKREHLAAGHLRQLPAVEVFLPRIRFRRVTRRGAVWVTEALFPNYLFACFDWQSQLRAVQYCPGVAGVVHFGRRWPTIPVAVIEDLRQRLGPEELREIEQPLLPGDAARIMRGPLEGLEGVVTRVLPARQRVRVLLEFLGRQVSVEMALDQVAPCVDLRRRW